MRLLLDTHVWLWLRASPERLPKRARAALEDERNALHFSAASAWEIATKHALGRLPLPTTPDAFVRQTIAKVAATALPISVAHATRAGGLPSHHRDPFDRLLVAQAQADDLVLVTNDEQLEAYDAKLLWR